MPVADSDGEPPEVAPDDLDRGRVVLVLVVEVVLRVVLAGQGHVVPLAPVVGLVAGAVRGKACGKKVKQQNVKKVVFLGKYCSAQHNEFWLSERGPQKKIQKYISGLKKKALVLGNATNYYHSLFPTKMVLSKTCFERLQTQIWEADVWFLRTKIRHFEGRQLLMRLFCVWVTDGRF